MSRRTPLIIIAALVALIVAIVASDGSWSLRDEMAYATQGER